MTVPFLRDQKFESSLSELQKVGENGNFTSYLTSFVSDGFKVYGLLTLPKGEKPLQGWPAIIFIHGYIPPESYRTQVNYISYVNYLARNKFVVFKIDLRGHGNSEGEAGGGYYSGDYVIDTLNAYSALEKAEFVDPKKIGLWGHSMAGNVVLRSMAAKPEIPASVIWAGAGYTYTDLQEYSIDDNSYRPPPADSERARKRQLLRDTYGNFNPDHWFWKQVVPTNYLSDLKGSIQLNHSLDDNVVSIDYSRNLSSLLDQAGINYELNEYPQGGHNMTGVTFTEAMEETVAFFNSNLK
jgi:dipeptidyl aminopeptidase/acylaminoacyl peptidase